MVATAQLEPKSSVLPFAPSEAGDRGASGATRGSFDAEFHRALSSQSLARGDSEAGEWAEEQRSATTVSGKDQSGVESEPAEAALPPEEVEGKQEGEERARETNSVHVMAPPPEPLAAKERGMPLEKAGQPLKTDEATEARTLRGDGEQSNRPHVQPRPLASDSSVAHSIAPAVSSRDVPGAPPEGVAPSSKMSPMEAASEPTAAAPELNAKARDAMRAATGDRGLDAASNGDPRSVPGNVNTRLGGTASSSAAGASSGAAPNGSLPVADAQGPRLSATASTGGEATVNPGTNGAENAPRMSNTEEKRRERQSALQRLPSEAKPEPARPAPMLAAKELEPRGVVALAKGLSATGEQTPLLSPHGDPASRPAEASSVVSSTALRASTVSPLLEQLHLRMVNGAMELRAVRAESMSVVIRPDAQTELFLHLKLQGGQVDVEARLQRGDIAALQSHWGQLQESLANQSIRLNPLQEPGAGGARTDLGQGTSEKERPLRDGEGHAGQARNEGDGEASHSRRSRPAEAPLTAIHKLSGSFERWA